MIDLRSDTVTKPSAAMREAMAFAPVGDDVYGEDPTVAALQRRAAEILGTEGALFVPSGTMANQIALQVMTRPGDEVIAGYGSHHWLFETGGAGAYAGVQHTLIAGDGRFTADDVAGAFKPDNHHFAPTRLVSVENTHNFGGGLVWDMDELRGVIEAATELGLATHLDGARIWNAATALGVPESALTGGFDIISACFSKGLGAPVGSIIAGDAERIRSAHRVRKRMGGGMRQAGILAAACLYALENNRARLKEDHANAARLGELLTAAGLSIGAVQTNIVVVEAPGGSDLLIQRAREQGVLFGAVGPRKVRLVTHLDVSAADIEEAASVIREIV